MFMFVFPSLKAFKTKKTPCAILSPTSVPIVVGPLRTSTDAVQYDNGCAEFISGSFSPN